MNSLGDPAMNSLQISSVGRYSRLLLVERGEYWEALTNRVSGDYFLRRHSRFQREFLVNSLLDYIDRNLG